MCLDDFIRAAKNGHSYIVSVYLNSADTNVNHTDSAGNTALIWAARFGHLKIVQLLLAAPGIDVFQANKEGDTALTWAVMERHNKVVRALLKSDCSIDDITKKNKADDSSLTYAIDNHDATILYILRKNIELKMRRVHGCLVDIFGLSAINYGPADEVLSFFYQEKMREEFLPLFNKMIITPPSPPPRRLKKPKETQSVAIALPRNS